MKKKMTRRNFFGKSSLGVASAVGMEQLLAIPLVGQWSSKYLLNPVRNIFATYDFLPSVLSGGFGLTKLAEAKAAEVESEEPWTVVTIKVVNHMYAPLIFKYGEIQADGSTVLGGPQPVANTASITNGEVRAHLLANGVDELSDNAKLKSLRFNKWFANMLLHGKDGLPAGLENNIGLPNDSVATLDESKVAIQTFHNMNQISNGNHTLKETKLRPNLPDLNFFLEQNNLVRSPLGITCFMMGGAYDKAEGKLDANAVLGSNGETKLFGSHSVSSYLSNIGLGLGSSYADKSENIEQNVVYNFDKLVSGNPKLRREILESYVELKKSQEKFNEINDFADPERTQNFVAKYANKQSRSASDTDATPANREFLAQCLYVAAASKVKDLSGSYYRNFSLFLNMVDLDGAKLDIARNQVGGATPQQLARIKSYTYIEGMRQLAFGLNILAKQIAAGTKMIVLVMPEGGRRENMADGKTSAAFLLGPKGSGLLDDAIYGNTAKMNAQTKIDTGNDPFRGAWTTPDGLHSLAGIKDTSSLPNKGDVQMGVAEFLMERHGKSIRTDFNFNAADGRYAKLKRGT